MAADKNEAFANNVKELGFVLEDGVYSMEENGVSFQLPNQKLPFFRDDFYVKNSFAYLEIDTTEISIQVFDEVNTVNITFNHNRLIRRNLDENGRT